MLKTVLDVEKAAVSLASNEVISSTELLLNNMNNDGEAGNAAVVEESLKKVRRRSAALEKAATSKIFDSFYDQEEDKFLLDILEQFESTQG